MDRKDWGREKYFKFWTKKGWKDEKNYDLILDTAKFSWRSVQRFYEEDERVGIGKHNNKRCGFLMNIVVRVKIVLTKSSWRT